MILVIFLLFSFILGFAAPRYTANFYIENFEKYVDTEVTLRLRRALPSKVSKKKEVLGKEGYVRYICPTEYNGEAGGSASVLVPEKSLLHSIRYIQMQSLLSLARRL